MITEAVMQQKLKFILTVLSFFSVIPSVFAAPSSIWTTPIQCAELNAKIALQCSKAKSEGELNQCKMPQRFTVFGKDGQALKEMTLPTFEAAELPAFKKAKTDTEMFAHTWQCIQDGNQSYLYISYSAAIGNAPNGEYEEYYAVSGEEIHDKTLLKKLTRIRDSVKSKTNFVKSIFPE